MLPDQIYSVAVAGLKGTNHFVCLGLTTSRRCLPLVRATAALIVAVCSFGSHVRASRVVSTHIFCRGTVLIASLAFAWFIFLDRRLAEG